MTKRSRKILGFGGALLAAHTLVYLVLSLNGRYEPMGWGLSGVKDYQWAPVGFVKDFKWRMPMIWIFLPDWEVDRFFWHTEDRMYDGKLPANRIAEQADAPNPANALRFAIGHHWRGVGDPDR